MLSVYGGTGFVGGAYCDMFTEESYIIPREQREPETNNILYFISTIHNYNIFDNPHLDIETNLSLLIDVLEECKNKENVIFNFVSSWFVYGKTEDRPANENSTCNPKGFYSITKRAAEQLLISYCETFGLNYRILRLCNIYGETDNKVLKKRNALQYMINELAQDKDIELYDGGENIRDFMHVKDACRAIKICVDDAPLNEIINIGSGNPYKFKDIMLYAKKALNSKGALNSCEPPSFHKTVQVRDMYLDVTKLKNIGFKPKYTIWEGLDMLINSLRETDNG
jgi:nucleoside-diphosphate-sugar epimerase|tara:strand:- start:8176 stop:9021 length:846 start_codon:yes stop_codon:yes gene_type:complete